MAYELTAPGAGLYIHSGDPIEISQWLCHIR